MPIKVLKYKSQELGPYKNGDVVNLFLPPLGTLDMSRSYVNIDCSLNDDAGMVHNNELKIVNAGQNYKQYAVSIVRNARLQKGKFTEDIKNVNVLKTNIYQHTMDYDEYESQRKLEAGGGDLFGSSMFRNLLRKGDSTGVDNSVYRRTGKLKIHMEDLFGTGLLKEYPSNEQTILNLELKPSLFVGHELEMPTVTCHNYRNTGGAAQAVDFVYLNTYADGTSNVLIDENNVPCWLGQTVTIASNPGVQNGANKKIVKIEIVNETITTSAGPPVATALAIVKVYFDSNIRDALAAATDLTNITLTNVDQVAPIVPVFSNAEIVVYKTSDKVVKKNNILPTFTSEEFNTGGVTNLSQQFYLEPNCMNAYVMLLNLTDNQLVSTSQNVLNYRIRNNQKDVTDRDVDYDKPLYYDRLSATLTSSGYKIKNFNVANGNINSFVACNYLPITDGTKTFNIDINGSDALVQNGIIFKQVNKVLES